MCLDTHTYILTDLQLQNVYFKKHYEEIALPT